MIERTILFNLPLSIKGFVFVLLKVKKFVYSIQGLLLKQIKKRFYTSKGILQITTLIVVIALMKLN